MKCYRRLSGASPRRHFHTFIVKTRVSGSGGSGRRRESDSPRVIAADGGAVKRRVKHAGPPTSRLGRHGDVWKLANDRAAAFLLFDKKHKRNQYQIWRCGAIKGQRPRRGGGGHIPPAKITFSIFLLGYGSIWAGNWRKYS